MGRVNLTIRLRVFLAFGLLLVVTMSLGFFAIDSLGRVNAAASELRSRWLPGTHHVARMSLMFEQYRIAEGRALVASTAEASRAVEDDLRARSGELRRQRSAYQQLIGSAEERAQRFDRTWTDYIAISDELMALIRRGAREQAGLIYNGKERAPVADARKAVAELMAFRSARAKPRHNGLMRSTRRQGSGSSARWQLPLSSVVRLPEPSSEGCRRRCW